MGCDWIEGAAYYGYIIKYNSFSQEKIAKQTKRSCLPTEIRTSDDFLFEECWESFCKWNLKVADEYLGYISCMLSSEDMPGLYEKRRPVNSCRIIFGYEFHNGLTLSEIKDIQELPSNLLEKISQFIYLFNKTDFFGGIVTVGEAEYGESGEDEEDEEEEGKKKKEKLEDETETEDKIKIWNLVINCEESSQISKELSKIQSLFKGPQLFCGAR